MEPLGKIVFWVVLLAGQCFPGEGPPNGERYRVGRSRTEPGVASLDDLSLLRHSPGVLLVPHGLADAGIAKVILENPGRRIIAEDGRGGFESYNLIDLDLERERVQWRSKEVPQLLIAPPIGKFARSSEGHGDVWNRRGPMGSFRDAHYDLSDNEGNVCRVAIYCGVKDTVRRDTLHEMVGRMILNDPRMTGSGQKRIVEGAGGRDLGWSARWASGDKVIDISARDPADAVVAAYLERFPSTIPSDFQINIDLWGMEELARGCELMQASIECANPWLEFEGIDRFRAGLSATARFDAVTPLVALYSQDGGRLYQSHVLDGRRYDFESYRRALFHLRREIAGKVAEILVRAEREGAYYDPAKQRYVIGKKREDMNGNHVLLVVGGTVFGAVCLALLLTMLWRRRRKGIAAAGLYLLGSFGAALVGSD